MTIEALLVLAVAWRGASLLQLAFLQTGLWWLKLLLVNRYYASRFVSERPRYDKELFRWFMRQGAAVGLGSFLLLSLTPGLLLVYRLVSPDLQDLGEIALLLQVFLILQQLLTIVTNSLLPALRASSDGDAGNLQSFMAVALTLAVSLGGGFAVALLFGIPLALELLPTTVFDGALVVLGHFAWILAIVLLLQVLRLALIAAGDVDGFLTAVGVGVMIAVLAMLAQRFFHTLDTHGVLRAMGAALAGVVAVQLVFAFRAGAVARPSLRALAVPVAALLAVVCAWHLLDPRSYVAATVLVVCLLAAAWRQFTRLRSV